MSGPLASLSPLFAPRMRLGDLAAFCRRMATSLRAGVDLRTTLAREAQSARGGAARRNLAAIQRAVGQGECLSRALTATDGFFPPLMCELVDVGEQTGYLGEIFLQLAEHYENQIQLRRQFLAAITWPMIQLTVAVGVVGFLIWIAGILGQRGGMPIDFLGFGLVGDRGLAIYLGIVAAVSAGVALLVRAANRGLIWIRPIQRALLRIPVLGSSLRTLALARLAWSLHLTMGTGMEVRRALRISLKSMRSAAYTDKIPAIEASIAAGNSIHETFRAAGGFPTDFLDTLHVGEQSGTLAESMATASRLYQEQARAALTTLTTFAGVAVWAVVAALIISLIFRLFSFYIGAINGALG